MTDDTDEADPMDWHRRTDDDHAERIIDAENAEAEAASIDPE